MKALMILKDIKINNDWLGLELNSNCVNDDVEQAIAELEALENRSCDGCKYFKSEDKSLGKCENYCHQTPNYTTLDFYCNRHEAREGSR